VACNSDQDHAETGGFPTLELTVSEVKPNAPVDIQVPDNVRQASVKVETDKIADGVWFLTAGHITACSWR